MLGRIGDGTLSFDANPPEHEDKIIKEHVSLFESLRAQCVAVDQKSDRTVAEDLENH